MKHKKDNKKKIGVIVMTSIIVLSMVFSIFAIMIDNQSQSVPQYNKHSFVMTNTGYQTKISGKYVNFNYYPTDIERITMDLGVIDLLKNSQGIAIIFNPNDNTSTNLQYIDLIRYELETQLDKTTYFGITEESSNYNLPIISCANATETYPFILINISSTTSFVKSTKYPGCIIMNAKLKELIAAKDRLVYSYYGIMS
jgi:hypothetical protein